MRGFNLGLGAGPLKSAIDGWGLEKKLNAPGSKLPGIVPRRTYGCFSLAHSAPYPTGFGLTAAAEIDLSGYFPEMSW